MTVNPAPPSRLYALDALRGIAALCVVFWHWQHFFYVGDNPSAFVLDQQPFFRFFMPLYQHGGLAVQLFFSISGFVFFWLFSSGISDRSIRPLHFAADRFSRLYPLHIVTFALVAVLQLLYFSYHSSYFVYQSNDWYHAALNIFLAPAWGLEKGWSFNAPIWSVSVEVLLYCSFFLICLTRRWKWALAAAACVLGGYLYPEYYKLGSGVLCFYIGGVTYALLEVVRRYAGSMCAVVTTTALCLGSWAYLAYGAETVDTDMVLYACFPLTLAMLAAAGYLWPDLLRSWAWLGDISYSSYLIHFPLQIIFAMCSDWIGFSRATFYQGWVMLLFFAVLVPLSIFSHRALERPAQRYLRRGRRTYAARHNALN